MSDRQANDKLLSLATIVSSAHEGLRSLDNNKDGHPILSRRKPQIPLRITSAQAAAIVQRVSMQVKARFPSMDHEKIIEKVTRDLYLRIQVADPPGIKREEEIESLTCEERSPPSERCHCSSDESDSGVFRLLKLLTSGVWFVLRAGSSFVDRRTDSLTET